MLLKQYLRVALGVLLIHTAMVPALADNPGKGNPKPGSVPVDSVITYGMQFLGKPYRYVKDGCRPMDCSGFLVHIFGRYDLRLGGSSADIATRVRRIKMRDVRPGDILFFQGRNVKSKRVGHSGIVVAVEGDRIRMLHSSVHGGIRYDYHDSPYYRRRFLFAGRLPELEGPAQTSVPEKEAAAESTPTPPVEQAPSETPAGEGGRP